jgi:biotin-dependent carboxylase-like uncharacterized protein
VNTLHLTRAGPLTTVQDLGRPGFAALGVGRSGAADRSALRLANRLVGNPESAAALEITGGGTSVRTVETALAALTGAACELTVRTGHATRSVANNAPFFLPAGAELTIAPAAAGLRAYLAVRGGIDVAPVLGSRATDTLSGLGPAPLRDGDRLRLGAARGRFAPVDVAPVPRPATGDLELRVVAGPRADWFADDAVALLCSAPYLVRPDSDRVGMRLDGPRLPWARGGELPSEGLVAGAVQVPPSGVPVLFMADHPVTGGYPVLAVVVEDDVDRAAQARPGQRLNFRPARSGAAARSGRHT